MLADTASGGGRMRLPTAKVVLSKSTENVGIHEGYPVNCKFPGREVHFPVTQAKGDTLMMRYLESRQRKSRAIAITLMVIGFALMAVLPALAADSWTFTGDLNSVRADHRVVQLDDGRILVAGGAVWGGGSFSAEIYDPATGTWSFTSPVNFSKVHGSLTKLADGRVLAAGYETAYSGIFPNAEIYDPATDTWTATGSMTQGRSGQMAVLLNDGRVLVAGNAGGSRTAELYDPATGVWTATGSMNSGHGEGTMTLLNDGRVLVAAGFNDSFGFDVVTQAEIYDPATGVWTTTGSMSIARYAHTATLLSDGRVLAAAGLGIQGQTDSNGSAEIYDPATGVWTRVGDLTTGRYQHTATLLADGRVLFAGGPWNPRSAEIFYPSTGAFAATTDLPADFFRHTAATLPNGQVLLAGGMGGNKDIGFEVATSVLYTSDGGGTPPPPPPPPAEPTTTHVSDLDGSSFWVNSRRWKATVTITVLDDLGNPVANATVDGNWSGGTSGSSSCSTDGSGVCSVTSGKIRKNKSSATFTVGDISHGTLSYDAAANGDPDGDSNGTAISVSKP